MTSTLYKPALLTLAVFLGACSSMPKTTPLLDQTRNDYRIAQDNPKVAGYAQPEMKQAREALELASAAANRNDSNETIDKLAYLAKQKIAVTQEAATQKSAEADVADAGRIRDQMRLDQRTDEADQARRNADQARLDTQIAQSETRQAQERTSQLEAQLADLSAKRTERGMVITLGDVLFGSDLSHLSAEGARTLQKLAEVLRQNQKRNVLIEGFTDSTGSAAHNQELSQRRGNVVRNTLADMGVANDRMVVRAYGEAYPVAVNDNKESRQLNRRVEIVVSNDNGVIPPR